MARQRPRRPVGERGKVGSMGVRYNKE